MEDENFPGTQSGTDGNKTSVKTGDVVADKATTGASSTVTSPEQPATGYGACLRLAREAMGVSLGDMAVRSRLSVQQIRALEEEDMSVLPEPVYVRAFIRGACRLLQIDAQPLVDDFNARFAAGDAGARRLSGEQGQIPETDPAQEQVISGSPKHRNVKVILLVSLITLVAAGLWAVYTDQFAFLHSGTEAQQIETGAESTTNTQDPPANANNVPAENAATQTTNDTKVSETSSSETPASSANKTESTEKNGAAEAQGEKIAETATPASETVEAQRVIKPIANAAMRRVEFRLTDASCWVQVISPAGRNLIAEEMKPGTVRTIDVPVGSRFTIGNPTRLQLTIDGQVRDLSKVTRSGIARLSIE